jgi:polar amino acid transport system permease protein
VLDAVSEVRVRPVVRPPRKVTPGRIVLGVVVLALIAIFLHAVITAKAMQWSVVNQYLFSSIVLHGLWVTTELTLITQAGAILLGTVLAVMVMSRNPVLIAVAHLYNWFFRGVPALVQLILWYNLALLFPELRISLPFTSLTLGHLRTNSVMTPFLAAVLGLLLHEAAFMCDVVRSGLESVDRGQREAATALGFTKRQVFSRVVLPQSMRVMIPNTGNRTIGTLKFTSLVSFLAVPELLYTVQSIYSRTLQTIPLLMVATIWYLVIVSVLTVVQHFVERHYRQDRADTVVVAGSGEIGPAVAGAGGGELQ